MAPSTIPVQLDDDEQPPTAGELLDAKGVLDRQWWVLARTLDVIGADATAQLRSLVELQQLALQAAGRVIHEHYMVEQFPGQHPDHFRTTAEPELPTPHALCGGCGAEWWATSYEAPCPACSGGNVMVGYYSSADERATAAESLAAFRDATRRP